MSKLLGCLMAITLMALVGLPPNATAGSFVGGGSFYTGVLWYNSFDSCVQHNVFWIATYTSDFMTYPASFTENTSAPGYSMTYLDSGYYNFVPGGGWSKKTVQGTYATPLGPC